jgi:molecular chaperone HtpG
MEKILKASGQKAPDQKRALEVNVNHPVMEKIKSVFESDTTNPVLTDYCDLLYDIAVISEGGKLDNPARFSTLVGDLMAKSI